MIDRPVKGLRSSESPYTLLPIHDSTILRDHEWTIGVEVPAEQYDIRPTWQSWFCSQNGCCRAFRTSKREVDLEAYSRQLLVSEWRKRREFHVSYHPLVETYPIAIQSDNIIPWDKALNFIKSGVASDSDSSLALKCCRRRSWALLTPNVCASGIRNYHRRVDSRMRQNCRRRSEEGWDHTQ